MNSVSAARIALLLFIPAIVFSEPGQAAKNDNLREKPYSDGRIVVAVKTGTSLDVQKREGSWYFVAIGKKTGWMPMLSVRRTKPAATTAAPASQTGRSTTGAIVNTTGVRGLTEETLATAAYSEDAVVAAEKNRVLPDSATEFAAAGGIAVQQVPSLAVPAQNGGKK